MAKATAGLGASPWVILSSCHFLFFKLYDRHKTQVKKKSHLILDPPWKGVFISAMEKEELSSQECKDGPQLPASTEAGEDCTWGLTSPTGSELLHP